MSFFFYLLVMRKGVKTLNHKHFYVMHYVLITPPSRFYVYVLPYIYGERDLNLIKSIIIDQIDALQKTKRFLKYKGKHNTAYFTAVLDSIEQAKSYLKDLDIREKDLVIHRV